MVRDGFTTRQRCVLYLLLLLQKGTNEGRLYSTLDYCFDDVLLQPRESLERALRSLSEKGLVELFSVGVVLMSARLTRKGRAAAEQVLPVRVIPFINTRIVQRVLRNLD